MRILKNLFRKKYCKNCLYRDNYYTNLQELRKLRDEIEYYNKFRNFVSELIDKKEKLLYINHSKEKFFIVTVIEEYNFQGRLSHLEFRGYNYNNLSFHYYKSQKLFVDVFPDDKGEYIRNFYIYDFLCIPNRGYGSIMMEVLLDYAKSFDVEYISGFLSFIDTDDEEHNQRLRHFYKKFGFNIDDKDRIKLEFNNS